MFDEHYFNALFHKIPQICFIDQLMYKNKGTSKCRQDVSNR